MICQNLGQSAFVTRMGSLGNLLGVESSQRDLIISSWAERVAL